MNTGQKNTKGRTIYRGPRGGEYVLGPAGRKIRSFKKVSATAAAPVAAATLPGNTGNRNTSGRVIYRGPRGGEYVIGAGGRKIRSFTRAPAAAAAPPARTALNNAKAHMNTLKTIKERKDYLRSRAGNLTLANWTALDKYKNTLTYLRSRDRAAAALAKKLSKFLKLSNSEYINKNGLLYNNQAKVKYSLQYQDYNNAAVRAFNKSSNFLRKSHIPYIGAHRPNQTFMTKLNLKNSTLLQQGKTYDGRNTGVYKKVYFNKNGDLYYISLNGAKHKVDDPMTRLYYSLHGKPNELRKLKRLVGRARPNYPRGAIPPDSPPPVLPRRTSPELLENMLNQIYNGGRGSNINARRYTAEERNVLARRLGESIAYFKQQRNTKKAEAAQHRATLRAPGLTDAQKQTHRNRAAAANERVGYYNDAVRAYTRGLRSVKPLTGAVTPRARAMPATPNRSTPAPANVNVNAIYMPLNRPHLVVKTPGAGTIYLNPNTFTGFMKNAGRVNIAPANVRNWLRMARRNFPNEALFRHPLAAKNVTARHIRFSRA